MSDYMQGYSEGFDEGRAVGKTEIAIILQDLIAELRAVHHAHACTDPEDYPCCCQECREHWPCGIEAAARSAERRLREMEDE